MNSVQLFVNLFAYAVFQLSSLFAWPSRYNAPGLAAFPFFVAGYFLPLLFVDFQAIYPDATLEILTEINLTGAVSMLVGIIVSRSIFNAKSIVAVCGSVSTKIERERISRRVLLIVSVGVIGVMFSFGWMNMIPMFAEDPFMAKFFKGQYKDKYDQISVVFRFSQFAIISSLPILIALVFDNLRSIKKIALALSAMIVLALSLTRAPVLDGVLALLAILSGKTRKRAFLFIFLATLICALGSAIYALSGLTSSGDNFIQDITSGAPDIFDHLSFLDRFDSSTDLTYGATFVGGLVPGNSQYNPAVYSLSVSNPGGDISDSASGGFRMPPSIWGYCAFGWGGAIIVPLLSGFVIGGASRVGLRRLASEASLLNKMLIYVWYTTVVGFVSGFYAMFYFGLLSMLLYMFVVGKLGGNSAIQQR